MTSLYNGVETLADDVQWFARAHELRLHVVHCDPEILEATVRIVSNGTRYQRGTVPYILCQAAFAGPDFGWPERAAVLDSSAGTMLAELEKRGRVVGPYNRPPPDPKTMTGFASRLDNLLTAARHEIDGVVVTLAPCVSDDAPRLLRELSLLLGASRLERVRWVLVSPPEAIKTSLVATLGERALVTDARTTEAAQLAFLRRLSENAAHAPPASQGFAGAGMAWPKQAPPRRPGAVPAPSLTPTESARVEFHQSIQTAAVALRSQQGVEGIGSLRRAHALALANTWAQEAAIVRLLIATTLATLGSRKLAYQELAECAKEARAAGLSNHEAQAHATRAALLTADKDTPAALSAYTAAVAAARAAGDAGKALLLELLRASGQLCLAAKQETTAIALWREALQLAEQDPATTLPDTAIEVARQLAALCRKRGLHAQAASLEAQAQALPEQFAQAAEARSAQGATE